MLETCLGLERFDRAKAVAGTIGTGLVIGERMRLNPSIDSGRLLERLEQAQAKIVLRFMKDRRATINKTSFCPRGILGISSVYHTATCDRNERKVACPPLSPL